jgi:hypothetical protein
MTSQTKYKDIRVTTNYEKNSKSIWPKKFSGIKARRGRGGERGEYKKNPKELPNVFTRSMHAPLLIQSSFNKSFPVNPFNFNLRKLQFIIVEFSSLLQSYP